MWILHVHLLGAQKYCFFCFVRSWRIWTISVLKSLDLKVSERTLIFKFLLLSPTAELEGEIASQRENLRRQAEENLELQTQIDTARGVIISQYEVISYFRHHSWIFQPFCFPDPSFSSLKWHRTVGTFPSSKYIPYLLVNKTQEKKKE